MIQIASVTSTQHLSGQRPLPIHEIERAVEHTSSETLRNVPTNALAYPLGKGSFAGALNDAARFKVVGDGPMTERQLVPDSTAAQVLVDSQHGERLLKVLGAAVSSIAGHERDSDLDTIILPKNVDSVMASTLVQNAASNRKLMRSLAQPHASSSPEARAAIQKLRAKLNKQYTMGAGAWNAGGTITFSPETARMILTSVGAYTPQAGDSLGTVAAKYAADLVNHVPTHEAQHSISTVSDAFYKTPGKWLEEALAEVLSNTPAVLARTAEKTGVNPHSYAGHLAHYSPNELGWKGWHANEPDAAEQRQNSVDVGRNYIDSQQVMRELLSNAGYSLGTEAQTRRTSSYLQSVPAEQLADRFAHTLVSKWNIDPTRTDELSKRIASVIDDKGGIEQLRKDFGIAQGTQ